MGKNPYSADDNTIPHSIQPHHLNRILADPQLKDLKNILKELSEKHKVSPQDLTGIAERKEQIAIPVSIYADKNLSMLELTVKYLKEELNLRFSQIARLLNRDDRTIWVTYSNSKEKSPSRCIIKESLDLPITILADRKFSILEKAVGYLKEECGLKFSEIARMLKRDDRTVWTCYNRLKNKRRSENEAR